MYILEFLIIVLFIIIWVLCYHTNSLVVVVESSKTNNKIFVQLIKIIWIKYQRWATLTITALWLWWFLRKSLSLDDFCNLCQELLFSDANFFFWWWTTIRLELFLGLEGQVGDLVPVVPPAVPGVPEEAVAVGDDVLGGTQDFLRFLGKTGNGITCKNKRSLELLTWLQRKTKFLTSSQAKPRWTWGISQKNVDSLPKNAHHSFMATAGKKSVESVIRNPELSSFSLKFLQTTIKVIKMDETWDVSNLDWQLTNGLNNLVYTNPSQYFMRNIT